jgi:hypothetical protein
MFAIDKSTLFRQVTVESFSENLKQCALLTALKYHARTQGQHIARLGWFARRASARGMHRSARLVFPHHIAVPKRAKYQSHPQTHSAQCDLGIAKLKPCGNAHFPISGQARTAFAFVSSYFDRR